jgi:putative NADH-flavin reductase
MECRFIINKKVKYKGKIIMKVALIGATGFIGSKILDEALRRGHNVTGIVRNISKLPFHKNIIAAKGDILNTDEIAKIIKGHDAIICSYNPGWTNPDIYKQQMEGGRSIINASKQSGIKRLIVVGGAGSLEVKPGVRLVDTPEFPKEYKEGALALAEVLYMLKNENELDWTFLSPSIVIEPGQRTGKFRLGTDQVLFNENGESKISVEDYAVAIIDELENPKHSRSRFTVGY